MSGKKDQPVEVDKKGASQDPRPLEADVADLKATSSEGRAKPKKARSRERRKRNMGPFE